MAGGTSQRRVGIIQSYINLLLGNMIPFVYTPIMLSLLGQNEYGLYKLASSAASYLSLASFGIGAAFTRYLIKARIEEGKEAEQKVFGLFHLIFQAIAVLTLIIGAIIALNIHLIYANSLTVEQLGRMRVLLIILALNTAVGFSATSYNGVVSSHERFIFLQVVNIVSTCALPCLNLVVLFAGYASIGITVSSLCINILIRIVYMIYVRMHMKLKPDFRQMPVQLLSEMLVFSFWVFLANIVSLLYNATDTLIIGAIPALATIGVAVYNVGATFNNIVYSIATAMSSIYAPMANKMVFSQASSQELTEVVTRVGRLQCYLITLICSGFVAFGQPFLDWYVGSEYAEAYWVAVLMMIPSCVPLFQSVALSIAQAKNMHRFRSIVYLFIAIANVIGTYYLVHHWGIVGAAAMTGIANIVGQGFIMNWYYWKKVQLQIGMFWKNILKIVWIPAAMCVATIFLGRQIDFYRLTNLILGILLYIVIFVGMCWKFAMSPYEKDIFLALIRKLRRGGRSHV